MHKGIAQTDLLPNDTSSLINEETQYRSGRKVTTKSDLEQRAATYERARSLLVSDDGGNVVWRVSKTSLKIQSEAHDRCHTGSEPGSPYTVYSMLPLDVLFLVTLGALQRCLLARGILLFVAVNAGAGLSQGVVERRR